MAQSNAIFYWLGVEVIVVLLWLYALLRAEAKIKAHAFFGPERPLKSGEFWRFLFCSIGFCLTIGFLLIEVSVHDPAGAITEVSGGVSRLLAACLITGVLLGICGWTLLKSIWSYEARFHRPNLTTWKEFSFRAAPTRRMTPEEKSAYFKKIDGTDFVRCLGQNLVISMLLPLILPWVDFMVKAPHIGFEPVLRHSIEGLFAIEAGMVILAVILTVLGWVLKKTLGWFGLKRTLV